MEALQEGIMVTILGMSVVFLVLIILWGVMELMRVFLYHPAKAETKIQPAVSEIQSPVLQITEDEETIAVIMAAIASNLNTSTYHLNIKSIRRVPSLSPAWNTVSRKENIDNRF